MLVLISFVFLMFGLGSNLFAADDEWRAIVMFLALSTCFSWMAVLDAVVQLPGDSNFKDFMGGLSFTIAVGVLFLPWIARRNELLS